MAGLPGCSTSAKKVGLAVILAEEMKLAWHSRTVLHERRVDCPMASSKDSRVWWDSQHSKDVARRGGLTGEQKVDLSYATRWLKTAAG